VQNGGRFAQAGKQLLTGHVGTALKTAAGGGSAAKTATAALGLAAIGAWVIGGAKSALHETAKVLSETTTPQLRSSWFSSTYWRVAGIAAVLTLPFLFAAAIQALIRSDLALLARATFGYLPLSMLAVGIAAPLTMLLLAASDQMSAVVSSAAGNASVHFLDRASGALGGVTFVALSPFLAFLIGVFTVGAALTLWLELLVREAAMYVIVLMLPLAFAAMVWPARRIWAVRAVELLVALILSKFAIVAVLSLGGAAMTHSVEHGSVSGVLAGGGLLLLSAFTPWVLLRLLPLTEIASEAAGSIRAHMKSARPVALSAVTSAQRGHEWARSATAEMARDALDLNGRARGGTSPPPENQRGQAVAPQGQDEADGASGSPESAQASAGSDRGRGNDGEPEPPDGRRAEPAEQRLSPPPDRSGELADFKISELPHILELGLDGFPPDGHGPPVDESSGLAIPPHDGDGLRVSSDNGDRNGAPNPDQPDPTPPPQPAEP
jgi:hypothetical protein